MDKYEKLINIFGSKIKYICSNYDKSYREDLEQELYLFLFNLTNNLNNNNKIINYENYIYICLKNKAIEIYKTHLNYRKQIYSLDNFSSNENCSYVDMIKDENKGEDEYFVNKGEDEYFYEYVKSNVLDMIDLLLTEIEATIIKKYYIENKTQKEISKEANISQQYVSKVIKNGLQKLKIYFNKKGCKK